MFLFFFLGVVFFSLMFFDMLYMWVMLEVIFFFVMSYLIYHSVKKTSVNGVVYYLFVQALSGLVLVLSFMSELSVYGNLYILNNSMSVMNFFFCLMSLFIKLSFYPFYLQVLVILSLLNLEQGFIFMIYPKLVPLLMLYDFLQQGNSFLVIFVFSVGLFMVSSVQGIKETDIRRILSWSSMSQLSWMVISLFSNLVILLVFFFFYASILYYFVESVSKMENFYTGFGAISMSSMLEVFVLLILLMMSSLAPFLFFYLKVLLIVSGPQVLFKTSLFFLLVMTISVLFFYLRLAQFMVSVSYTVGFFKLEFLTPQNWKVFFLFFLYMLGSFYFLLF